MRLQLGINTCFAVKRWPHPDDWAPLVRDRLGLRLVQHSLDLVDTVRCAGAPGVGCRRAASRRRRPRPRAPLNVHRPRRVLGEPDAGVRPDRSGSGARVVPRRHRAHVVDRRTCDRWPRRLLLGAGLARSPAPDTSCGRICAAALGELATEARGAGLEYLVVENLAVAREPSTMAMIGELLDDGDATRVPIRLCLDVGHMVVPGTDGPDRDPYAWLRTLGRSAPIVQLQQSDADGDHHWPFTAADQRRRSHLGRTRDRGTRGGRRRGVRAGAGGHSAVRAGR